MTLRRSSLLAACAACAALLGPGRASAEPPPITAELADLPLYGLKDGLVYLRDPRDLVRLYPHAELDLDAHAFFGQGAETLSAEDAGVDLATRFFVRHARFDLGGELFERIGFDVGMDLVANPAVDGARADPDTKVALTDAWASLDAGRGLALMLGVFEAPFSLENRSATTDLAMMEKSLPIRFTVPGGRALGVAIGGSAQYQRAHWDVGVFGAESVTPGEFERSFDGIGRLWFRPCATAASGARTIQFGLSARVGSRQPRDVTTDTAAITTGQGFALWRPTRADAFGRTVHVIPSDLQWSTGVELRIPLGAFVLRGEGYWVSRNTREAIEGYQATNTERLGRLQGMAWYGELSWWPFKQFGLIDRDPPSLGEHPHADHLELARAFRPAERYGVELAALGGGVNGSYDGAARLGAADPSARATAIEVYQLGFAASYWHTSHVKLSVNTSYYLAPRSGGPDNLADVPGNLGPPSQRRPDAHVLWETGIRTTVMF